MALQPFYSAFEGRNSFEEHFGDIFRAVREAQQASQQASELLGIEKRHFILIDILCVSGPLGQLDPCSAADWAATLSELEESPFINGVTTDTAWYSRKCSNARYSNYNFKILM